MRTASWASLALLALPLSAALQTQVELPQGGSIRYSSKKAETRFEIRTAEGKRFKLPVKRDASVAPNAAPAAVKIVGEVRGAAIILTDTYPSLPGGMSYCQAGEERFLRIISIARSSAQEKLSLKLESCRDTIELASPGLDWQPDSSTLRIRWLTNPAIKEGPLERTFRIGPDGTPQP